MNVNQNQADHDEEIWDQAEASAFNESFAEVQAAAAADARFEQLLQEIRESRLGWAGDEAYVIDALDAPGYMDIPETLHLEDLTRAELLAGVKLGYMARPQPWMDEIKMDARAADSFLYKVLTEIRLHS